MAAPHDPAALEALDLLARQAGPGRAVALEAAAEASEAALLADAGRLQRLADHPGLEPAVAEALRLAAAKQRQAELAKAATPATRRLTTRRPAGRTWGEQVLAQRLDIGPTAHQRRAAAASRPAPPDMLYKAGRAG